MKNTESLFVMPESIGPYLQRAASAGVVSGCGAGNNPAFDARGLAILAVTQLHEGREAVDARLSLARQELERFDAARAGEAAAPVPPPSEPDPAPRKGLVARLRGWFRRRPAAPPAEPPAPPVSRAELVRQIHRLEARSRELLAIEADFAGLFKAEFDGHRMRVMELPLNRLHVTGGK